MYTGPKKKTDQLETREPCRPGANYIIWLATTQEVPPIRLQQVVAGGPWAWVGSTALAGTVGTRRQGHVYQMRTMQRARCTAAAVGILMLSLVFDAAQGERRAAPCMPCQAAPCRGGPPRRAAPRRAHCIVLHIATTWCAGIDVLSHPHHPIPHAHPHPHLHLADEHAAKVGRAGGRRLLGECDSTKTVTISAGDSTVDASDYTYQGTDTTSYGRPYWYSSTTGYYLHNLYGGGTYWFLGDSYSSSTNGLRYRLPARVRLAAHHFPSSPLPLAPRPRPRPRL